MTRKAIIHIGIDKTGSTTIQNTLFSMRSKLLSEAGILYPSVAANHSIYVMTVFRDKAPPILQLVEPDATDESSIARARKKFRDSLDADIADPSWHTLIISAESLCDFYPKAIAHFIEWLTEYVSDIRVVAYVRHPVDWTRSVVQERLKAGETLDQLYKNMRRPNWRQRFKPWLDAVGLERFQLVSFEEARENDGVMASFCDAASLPRETILPLAPATSANESMSLEAVLLLDSLNRQRPLFTDGKLSSERLWNGIDAIMPIPGNKFHLDAEHAAKAQIDNRPDLEWLNATFGTDLYPDIFEDVPFETPVGPDTMPQATVDALAIMLSNFGNQLQNTQVHNLQNATKLEKKEINRLQLEKENLRAENDRLKKKLLEMESTLAWRLHKSYVYLREGGKFFKSSGRR